MGIVSDEELQKELNNSHSPSSTEIINLNKRGRGEGNLAVPDSLRKIIGEESEINGRDSALEIARHFDVSPSSVSAYSNGAHSTKTYDKTTDVVNHINKTKERISKKARSRLISALNHITDDKLSEAKPDVLANVARNMSAIVKDMEPEIKSEGPKSGPMFIMYRPEFKSEKAFDVIDLKEN